MIVIRLSQASIQEEERCRQVMCGMWCTISSLSADSYVLSTLRVRQLQKPRRSSSEAQRCYESPSRQLKNEGEKFSRTSCGFDVHVSMHCLQQWPYHSRRPHAASVLDVYMACNWRFAQTQDHVLQFWNPECAYTGHTGWLHTLGLWSASLQPRSNSRHRSLMTIVP